MNWQPISTAPLDGTRILLYWPDLYSHTYIGIGRWDKHPYVNNSKPFWRDDSGTARISKLRSHPPTHWCKLEAPKPTDQELGITYHGLPT